MFFKKVRHCSYIYYHFFFSTHSNHLSSLRLSKVVKTLNYDWVYIDNHSRLFISIFSSEHSVMEFDIKSRLMYHMPRLMECN